MMADFLAIAAVAIPLLILFTASACLGALAWHIGGELAKRKDDDGL